MHRIEKLDLNAKNNTKRAKNIGGAMKKKLISNKILINLYHRKKNNSVN